MASAWDAAQTACKNAITAIKGSNTKIAASDQALLNATTLVHGDTVTLEARVAALEALDAGARLRALEAGLSALSDRVTALEHPVPKPPDPVPVPPDPVPVPPDPTPPTDAMNGWPLFPYLGIPQKAGTGAGNSPVDTSSKFTAMRVRTSRPGSTRKMIKLWLKAKEDVNYAKGHPQWNVDIFAVNPADGSKGVRLQRISVPDVMTTIVAGNAVLDLSGIPEQWVWIWVTSSAVDTPNNFASVNFHRCTKFSGAPHMADDWAKRGSKSQMGMDRAMGVYHCGYGSGAKWGDYGTSENLMVIPTFAIGFDDGTFEGSPTYGSWGTKGDDISTFTAVKDGTLDTLYGVGPMTVDILLNGAKKGSASWGAGATLPTIIPITALTIKRGDLLALHNTSTEALAMSMDGAEYTAIGKKFNPAFSSDGLLPCGPAR